MVYNSFTVALYNFEAKTLTSQLISDRVWMQTQRIWPVFALSSSFLKVVNGFQR